MDPVIRTMLKRSKAELDAGRYEEALLEAQLALDIANHDKRRYRKDIPIIEHRIAMALKMQKKHQAAREQFECAKASLVAADPSNRIARAILQRDFGFFLGNELRDYEHAQEEIGNAARLLRGSFPSREKERAKLELVATNGFKFRIRLRKNRFDHAALDGLKEVDKQLRELARTKPGYVLDNIVWILRYEKRAMEANRYLPRAIALSIKVGNLKRTTEYTFMLSGGQALRAALDRFF